MYANYHTHTYLSNHAIDTPRDYVESALAGGTKLLGFSDHVPYPFSTGHHSGFRIAVADTEKYVSEIAALRDGICRPHPHLHRLRGGIFPARI